MKDDLLRIPAIVCPKCLGEGEIPLPDMLEETLNAVRKRPGRTATDYAKGSGVSPNAWNNRLNELFAADLVRRERQSHSWKWYPVR